MSKFADTNNKIIKMGIDEVRDLCMDMTGVTEDMPYGPDVVTFRIEGKIFAMIGLERLPATIAVKLTPERNDELREQYDTVTPAYHCNKRHWSDIEIDSHSGKDVAKWIREAYDLVISGLPKSLRMKYER